MWWQYLLVFLGTLIVDVVPIPLPPAFTVMIFFQIKFDLNVWAVVGIGVAGSILGRYLLTLYIPYVSAKIFTRAKNNDVEFLGKKLKEKKTKSQLFILVYSLMPLPTTPLFLAGGMAKLKPINILPPFIIGKIISDLIAVLTGKFAAENTSQLVEGIVSWQTISGLVLGLLLVFFLLFLDWETLLVKKKFQLKFNIWRKKPSR